MKGNDRQDLNKLTNLLNVTNREKRPLTAKERAWTKSAIRMLIAKYRDVLNYNRQLKAEAEMYQELAQKVTDGVQAGEMQQLLARIEAVRLYHDEHRFKNINARQITERALKMRLKGKSWAEIENLLGVSRRTFQAQLTREGRSISRKYREGSLSQPSKKSSPEA